MADRCISYSLKLTLCVVTTGFVAAEFAEIKHTLLDSISAVKYLLSPGVAFTLLLPGSFKGHLFCIFQQLRASGCAAVVPATVVSVASLLANLQPAPMVRKASQPGLQDPCPNNRRALLSNDPDPVEMQLQIPWPVGADRADMVSFNLCLLCLKVQGAAIYFRLYHSVMWVVSRNKQAVTTAVASELKSCALMLWLEDFFFFVVVSF